MLSINPGRWTALVAALAASAVLAACGGDDGEDTTAAAPAATTSTAAAGGDCVAEATAAVDEARAEVPLKVPGEAIDMASLKGKNVWLVLVVTNQFTQTVGDEFKNAAQRAGLKATVFDGKGQASQWAAGVQQAVAQGADGIILWAIQPAAVSKPLADAQEKGIAVIDVFNGAPQEPVPNGLFAHVTADFNASGETMANWMLADSKCKANAALFSPSVLTLYKGLSDAIPATLESCEECSYTFVDEDLAKIATELGPSVTNTLRRKSEINYVVSANDSQISFIAPAVQKASRDVKVIGHDGVPASLDLIRKGDGSGQDATLAFPPEKWIGYAILDQLARGMTDGQPADLTIPTRLIDASNVGDDNAALYGNWAGFEDEFAKVWGIR